MPNLTDDEKILANHIAENNISGLRKAVASYIFLDGSKKTIDRLESALLAVYSERWYSIHFTLLQLFDMEELIGIDCNLLHLLKNIPEFKNKRQLKRHLENVLMEQTTAQLETNGSTLLFDIELMEQRPSASLLGLLITQRQREFVATRNLLQAKGILDENLDAIDLTELAMSSYGLGLLKSFKVPLIVRGKQRKPLIQAIEKFADELSETLSESLLNDFAPVVTDQFASLARSIALDSSGDAAGTKELFRIGYFGKEKLASLLNHTKKSSELDVIFEYSFMAGDIESLVTILSFDRFQYVYNYLDEFNVRDHIHERALNQLGRIYSKRKGKLAILFLKQHKLDVDKEKSNCSRGVFLFSSPTSFGAFKTAANLAIEQEERAIAPIIETMLPLIRWDLGEEGAFIIEKYIQLKGVSSFNVLVKYLLWHHPLNCEEQVDSRVKGGLIDLGPELIPVLEQYLERARLKEGKLVEVVRDIHSTLCATK